MGIIFALYPLVLAIVYIMIMLLYFTLSLLLCYVTFILCYRLFKGKNKNAPKKVQKLKIPKNTGLFSTNVDIIVINTWYGVSICTRFSAPVLQWVSTY